MVAVPLIPGVEENQWYALMSPERERRAMEWKKVESSLRASSPIWASETSRLG